MVDQQCRSPPKRKFEEVKSTKIARVKFDEKESTHNVEVESAHDVAESMNAVDVESIDEVDVESIGVESTDGLDV